MKTRFTLKNFFFRKEGWLSVFLLAVFVFFGCYEFYTIDQPTEAYTNDTFSVPLVVKADGDPGNDFTVDGLQAFGLFGVLVPTDWTVDDSIYYSIVASDSAIDGSGTVVYADKDYSNDGYLIYNEAQSKMLTDSIGAPEGYTWWGAKTDRVADMTFFDSLYFTVDINTSTETGTFYLQYAVGDKENDMRVPSHILSDPIPINITENPNTGITKTGMKQGIAVYPNPTDGIVTIELQNGQIATSRDLMVFDVSGKLILSRQFDNLQTSVDLSGQKPGTYFIRVRSANEDHSYKILLR